MPKRTVDTGLPTNPTVRLADKVGSRFVGEYLTVRDVTVSGKPNKLYELAAIDGDALITIKDPKGGYREAEINEGDTVSLFGSKAIDIAFAQAEPGEVVELIFNGEKKLKGGRKFNDYAIGVWPSKEEYHADIKG